MKIRRIEQDRVAGGSRLYADYCTGGGEARGFFSLDPLDFGGALAARSGAAFPRRELAAALRRYNEGLGAHESALANIDAIADEGAYVVATGQQAGFLGGPIYALYKILTAIRLAAHCADALGRRFVPLFWLATDDHDIDEVNHAYVFGADGEVGKVQFDVDRDGRPVEALCVTAAMEEAHQRYFAHLAAGALAQPPSPRRIEEARGAVPRPAGDRYGRWIARIWSRLFSSAGLVVIEPSELRSLSGRILRTAIDSREEIARLIAASGDRLREAGYEPAELSPQAGTLFTFDESGRRVRFGREGGGGDAAEIDPERYSGDALLRPVIADAMIPTVAHVVGPGEIGYHARLKPLYELFGVGQPLLFPRKHYTVQRAVEEERLSRYGLSAERILTDVPTAGAWDRTAVSDPELGRFDEARAAVRDALAPLLPYVEGIDPGLARTHQRSVSQAERAVDALRRRVEKALAARRDLSRGELRRLANLVLPRGRLQERIFPLPHFIALAGKGFIDAIRGAGEIEDFSHLVVTLEEHDGGH